MKKATTIIGAILLIASLTGLRLYKKHQKAQVKEAQETLQREQLNEMLYQQKEAKIAKYKEEEKRINDSIAQSQQNKLNEGLQMLREAKEKINKEIEAGKK